jgi:Na+/H+ antiporter NhaB
VAAESNVGGSLVLMCGNRTAFTTEVAIDTTMQLLPFDRCLLLFECVVKRIGPTHAFKPIIEAVLREFGCGNSAVLYMLDERTQPP